MSGMQELYQKVAADGILQEKFNAIMKDAETDGEEITKERLAAFSKEAGYEISMAEMQGFFKEMAAPKVGELSDTELDMVAGGKSEQGRGNIATSVLSLGFGCALMSLGGEMVQAGGCGSIFK